VSSTKIRLFRKRGKSIRYFIPDEVVDYIYEHGLYGDDDQKQSEQSKGPPLPDTSGSGSHEKSDGGHFHPVQALVNTPHDHIY
jgi:hypothetical protein